MDDLIGRLDANISVDRTAAETAAVIVAHFSIRQSRATTARALTRHFACAGQSINATQRNSYSGVVLGAFDGVERARMTGMVTRTLIDNVCGQAGKNAAGVIAGAAPRLPHSV
jgi:hypothetical protein